MVDKINYSAFLEALKYVNLWYEVKNIQMMTNCNHLFFASIDMTGFTNGLQQESIDLCTVLMKVSSIWPVTSPFGVQRTVGHEVRSGFH